MPSHDIPTTSKARQCAAILAALRTGPLTTIEAREGLGVLHPGGRVLELRRAGHDIRTISRWDPDAAGRLHKVAAYHLISEAHHG
jgi:Helix-turn-helix domain